MGKKKSKVSKQKQVKAKKRHSSLGGVAVTKGSTSKFRQSSTHNSQSVLLHTVNSSKKDAKNKVTGKDISASPVYSIDGKECIQPIVRYSSCTVRAKVSPSQIGVKPRLGSIREEDEEKKEFDEQMASLQERQWIESQRSTVSNKKKGKKASLSSTTDSTSNALSTIFPQIQPASFKVEKTTNDLLHEAMHEMVHMTGVGISAVEKTPIRSNKKTVDPQLENCILPMVESLPASTAKPQFGITSLAAASKRHEEDQAKFYHENSTDNRFAALGNGDDDDDDTSHAPNQNNSSWSLKIQSPSSFNFAPPSFSLMPRETPTPVTTPNPSHKQSHSQQLPLPQQQQQQLLGHVPTHQYFFSNVSSAAWNGKERIVLPVEQQEIDPDL